MNERCTVYTWSEDAGELLLKSPDLTPLHSMPSEKGIGERGEFAAAAAFIFHLSGWHWRVQRLLSPDAISAAGRINKCMPAEREMVHRIAHVVVYTPV